MHNHRPRLSADLSGGQHLLMEWSTMISALRCLPTNAGFRLYCCISIVICVNSNILSDGLMKTRKPNSSDRLKKIQLALYLDSEQVEALKELSKHTRVAQQAYLREALDYLLEKYGAKVKDQKMYTVGADTLTDAELNSFDAAIQAARREKGLLLAFIHSEPLRGPDGHLCEVRVYEGLARTLKATVPIRPNGKPGPVRAS